MGANISKLTNKEIAEIIAERDFYKKILDKIPAVIHLNNLNTELVEWVNDTAETTSGFKKDAIINNPGFLIQNIVDDDLRWIEESIMEYKKDDGINSYLYSMKNADGSVNNYHGIGVVFDYDEHGKPTHNLAIDINITHEIRNYKQLKKQYEELTKKINQDKTEKLTEIEKQVIKHICSGKTVKETAEVMCRSLHTIDNHKRNIFIKLNVHKTRQLASFAKEVGLL